MALRLDPLLGTTQPRLYVFDALTGNRLWTRGMNRSWTPVAVKAFLTAGGGRRVAVLTQRGSDQRPIVSIYNANTGALIQNVLFRAGQTAVDLTIFPDTTLDIRRQPELGVTMDDGSIRIRDSVTKQLLQTLSVN